MLGKLYDIKILIIKIFEQNNIRLLCLRIFFVLFAWIDIKIYILRGIKFRRFTEKIPLCII